MREIVRTGGIVLLAALASPLLAGQATALRKGERGAVTVEPALARPAVAPCIVDLFTGMRFDAHGDPAAMTAQPHPFRYAPPAACPGPWAKVVLEADFAVTAGRQYDRTASLWLHGVNLFFGTTQEPGKAVAPHWRVERDLTDYASVFRRAGEGQAILNNWVDARYTGVIRGNARLVFYPAAKGVPAAHPFDRVYGLVGDAQGAPVPVQDGAGSLSRRLTLPRNVEGAWLDVIAQSQSTDEQWYMCIDDADLDRSRDYALGPPANGDPLGQCGNGNFREVEVQVDGQPAGRAPVYPWVYTGGIDPNLWRPVPGVQTLGFVPYRVDLTPFAAQLDDGRPHTVSVRVLGAHHFFNLAANLLLRLDHGRTALTGRLLQNTLATGRGRLAPRVERAWNPAPKDGVDGHVDTLQHGDYVIAGELDTSHGMVSTKVTQQSDFANRQRFLRPDATTYRQVIALDTRVVDTVATTAGGRVDVHRRELHYPMQVDVAKHMQPDGRFTSVIGVQQGYAKRIDDTHDGKAAVWSTLDDALESAASTDFNATGTAITGSRDQHGRETFRYGDTLGSCYAQGVATRDEAVDSVAAGTGCPGGANRLDWRSRPYGM